MSETHKRHKDEDRLVTDGKQIYRLAPRYKVPKGLIVFDRHEGKSVYKSNGKLKSPYNRAQGIQPRNNVKLIVRAIHYVIESGLYHENIKNAM